MLHWLQVVLYPLSICFLFFSLSEAYISKFSVKVNICFQKSINQFVCKSHILYSLASRLSLMPLSIYLKYVLFIRATFEETFLYNKHEISTTLLKIDNLVIFTWKFIVDFFYYHLSFVIMSFRLKCQTHLEWFLRLIYKRASKSSKVEVYFK